MGVFSGLTHVEQKVKLRQTDLRCAEDAGYPREYGATASKRGDEPRKWLL